MPYVVKWVPTFPEMTVLCHTAADAMELTAELKSTGRGSDVRIMRDDQEIDVDMFARSMRDADEAKY